MKKMITLLGILLLVVGCKISMEKTPSDKVSEWLERYQITDNSIMGELEEWLQSKGMEDDNQKKYQELMEKQHQNMSYEIISEKIDGNTATVEVEIEVLDYGSSIAQSKEYFMSNQEEFIDTPLTEGIENLKEFIEYELQEMSKVEKKVKYTMTFELRMEDDEWKIVNVDKNAFEKIYGLYEK